MENIDDTDYKWNDENIYFPCIANSPVIEDKDIDDSEMTNTLKNLFIFIEKFVRNKCICIETGIQHHFDPTNLDYYSTSNLLNCIVRKKEGTLYSFDNEPEHIKRFKESELYKINTEWEKYLRIIEGDSTEQLKIFVENLDNTDNKIDLALLDSKEFDEDHMLNEFKIIEKKIITNDHMSIIMCDDIHNPSSTKYKKAVPYIKDRVDLWFEYNTPTGLFVGIFGIEK